MKKTTKASYVKQIYKVINYIETNYQEDLNLEKLSKISGFSKYHFHRIFHTIVGETLSSFIRKIRLEKSTHKLIAQLPITEVAMQSGYETHAAFAKAFKQRFKLSPKEFVKKIYKNKGNIMVEPKVVNFQPVEVLCVQRIGEYTTSAKEAFEVLMKFAYNQKIKHKKDLMGKKAQMFGIGYDDPNTTPSHELRYDACISYDDKSVKPEGEISIKTIEGGKHLYYLHKGPYEKLKDVYSMLMHYIIENEMTMANRAPFEKYLNRDPRRTKPENLKTEIYIPIN